jgi:hypothetical protein
VGTRKNGEPREIILSLPVPLKDSAREKLLDELLDKRKQIDVHVEERKAVNSKIRPLQKDCGLIEGKLRTGAEHRDVKWEVYELSSNEVEIIRTDTRAVVQRRTMTAAERQGEWDWASATQNKVDEAKAAAAAASDDAGDDDQADDEDEGDAAADVSDLPVTNESTSPLSAYPQRKAKRSSKGKPPKRTKGRGRAAAHAR